MHKWIEISDACLISYTSIDVLLQDHQMDFNRERSCLNCSGVRGFRVGPSISGVKMICAEEYQHI